MRYLVLRDSSKSGTTKLNNYKSAMLAILAAILISFIGSAPNMLKYRVEYKGLMIVPDPCLDSKYGYKMGQELPNYSIVQPEFWNCSWDRFAYWTSGLLLKIIPCLLLTIFMAFLVQMLIEAKDRRSRLTGGSTNASTTGSHVTGPTNNGGKNQAERTTTMLIIIVGVFLVTELPQGKQKKLFNFIF